MSGSGRSGLASDRAFARHFLPTRAPPRADSPVIGWARERGGGPGRGGAAGRAGVVVWWGGGGGGGGRGGGGGGGRADPGGFPPPAGCDPDRVELMAVTKTVPAADVAVL